MATFKTIVLTTDLSENSEAAAPYAAQLAAAYGGTIHVLFVFEDVLYQAGAIADGTMGFDPEAWLAMNRDYNEKHFKEVVASIPVSENTKIVPHFVHGNAAAEIVKLAKQTTADCIVMATHGRSGVAHFFFGSVAEKVMRTSPCPVLTIRPEKITVAQKQIVGNTEPARNKISA